jgi:hypothetical protein
VTTSRAGLPRADRLIAARVSCRPASSEKAPVTSNDPGGVQLITRNEAHAVVIEMTQE